MRAGEHGFQDNGAHATQQSEPTMAANPLAHNCLVAVCMGCSLQDGPRLRWMVAIHLSFVVSGVLMALMDWIASKAEKHVPSEG